MANALVALALGLQSLVPVAKFDAGRAWEHLRQMVAIGPRPSGSSAIEQTRTYLKQQLAANGLIATEQAWDDQTPLDKVHMVNLVVTIPGARKERIVIAGHYDTKLYRQFRFVGASDGGSSAAFLLELARVLKTRKNPMTIELLFLDGEEAVCKNWDDCNKPGNADHTYGSRYYAQQAKQTGTVKDVRAFILVDMIADTNLDMRRESNSTPWLTDAIWSTAKKMNRPEFVDDPWPIEDDHLEFLEVGIESVDLIDLDYPAWHTAADDLQHVSAKSLQAVGDVVVAALPLIETRLR